MILVCTRGREYRLDLTRTENIIVGHYCNKKCLVCIDTRQIEPPQYAHRRRYREDSAIMYDFYAMIMLRHRL